MLATLTEEQEERLIEFEGELQAHQVELLRDCGPEHPLTDLGWVMVSLLLKFYADLQRGKIRL